MFFSLNQNNQIETIVRNYKIVYFIHICLINGHLISISLSLKYVSPKSKS